MLDIQCTTMFVCSVIVVCAIGESKVQHTIQPCSLDTNSLNFCFSFVSDIGYNDVMDKPSFLKVASNRESVGQ